jgi:hypothetical protein
LIRKPLVPQFVHILHFAITFASAAASRLQNSHRSTALRSRSIYESTAAALRATAVEKSCHNG